MQSDLMMSNSARANPKTLIPNGGPMKTPLKLSAAVPPSEQGFKETAVEGSPLKQKKKRKKLPKEERQRRREEAKLKSIYGPKDSKVSFIDASVLQKLNRNTAPKSNAASFLSPDDFPSISSTSRSVVEDFPALGPIPSKVTNRAPVTSVQLGSSSYSSVVPLKPLASEESSQTKPEDESAWEDENEGAWDSTGNNNNNTGSTKHLILGTVPEPTSTKRKSKAPLLISLDALITVPAEKDKRKNAKKLKELKVAAEKKTVGNTLDSSGPMLMNRGKIRNRKKKVSALKKTIITGRLLRKQMMESKGEDKRVDLPKSYRSSTQITEDVKTPRLDSLELKPAPSNSTVVTVEQNSQRSVPGDVVSMAMVSKPEPTSKQSVAVPSIGDGLSNLEVQDIPSAPKTQGDAEVDLFAKLLDNAIQEQVIEKIPKINVGEDIIQTCETNPEGVCPEVYEKAKQSLHSRKFRAYCNMFVSKELHGHVIALMKELHRFQDRLYHTDRVKYQTKRRYVHGIKDALSYLKINKVVLVILSPDIERNNVEGGLDDKISQIIGLATERKVPVVFSGNRYILGKPIMIKTPVSVIAVLDKQGAEPLFQIVIEEASKLRGQYEEELQRRIQQLSSSPNSTLN